MLKLEALQKCYFIDTLSVYVSCFILRSSQNFRLWKWCTIAMESLFRVFSASCWLTHTLGLESPGTDFILAWLHFIQLSIFFNLFLVLSHVQYNYGNTMDKCTWSSFLCGFFFLQVTKKNKGQPPSPGYHFYGRQTEIKMGSHVNQSVGVQKNRSTAPV